MIMSVVYDHEDITGLLSPVWVVLESSFDWSKTLYFELESPFERLTFDEIDNEVLAFSVPDLVYIRHPGYPYKVGLHLPSLQAYINKLEQGIDFSDIHRLMLRISDIENILQVNIQRGDNNENSNLY